MEADLAKCWFCKTESATLRCPERCQIAVYCNSMCAVKDKYRHAVECENGNKVLTCQECGQRSNTLKACQGCFLSFYCGKDCQKKNWATHKDACRNSAATVIKLATRCFYNTPYFNIAQPWYISNSSAEDYLKLYQNEGLKTKRFLKLLFLGVGDINDIIRTIADLPPDFGGQLKFTLNDFSPHVMARNLLFFYCAWVYPNEKYAAHLVQIWYSVLLTKSCAEFLSSLLNQLITQSHNEALIKMHHLVDITEEHWHQCCNIWSGWQRLSKEKNAASRILREREKIITPTLQALLTVTSKNHVNSMKAFMEKGVLFPLNSCDRLNAVKVNPCMTCFNPIHPSYAFKYKDISPLAVYEDIGSDFDDLEEMIYCIKSQSYVFCSWDYLEIRKNYAYEADLMTMYKSYLERVFNLVFNKIKENKIRMQVVIDDFQNINNYLPEDETFDRICTSDLSDFFYTPFVLEKFSPLLNRENPFAVLITHNRNWVNHITKELYDPLELYRIVERALKDEYSRPDLLANDELVHSCPFNFQLYALNCYVNNYPYFQQYMLAEFVIYLYKRKENPLCKSSIKLMPQVLKKFNLQLRDCRRELNRVIPFFREELTRRLTAHYDIVRRLEWVPS